MQAQNTLLLFNNTSLLCYVFMLGTEVYSGSSQKKQQTNNKHTQNIPPPPKNSSGEVI